jgi:hypothetical protein
MRLKGGENKGIRGGGRNTAENGKTECREDSQSWLQSLSRSQSTSV